MSTLFGSSSNPQQPSGQNLNLNGSHGNAAWVAIVVIIFAVGLPLAMVGMFVFGWGANLPIIGGMVTQGTVVPPGDVMKFDPIATFAEVQTYAGENAKIYRMTADFVKADGTMDLKAKYGVRRATVTYDFFNQLSEPPVNAPPIGAGGSPDGKWYEPVRITISHPGETRYMQKMSAGYSFKGNYMHQGMDKSVSPAVGETYSTLIDPPTCPFKPFWDSAIAQGAPKDALASISYDEYGYKFKIDNTDINLKFGLNCKLIP